MAIQSELKKEIEELPNEIQKKILKLVEFRGIYKYRVRDCQKAVY